LAEPVQEVTQPVVQDGVVYTGKTKKIAERRGGDPQ